MCDGESHVSKMFDILDCFGEEVCNIFLSIDVLDIDGALLLVLPHAQQLSSYIDVS
jgi:hypothetical protein